MPDQTRTLATDHDERQVQTCARCERRVQWLATYIDGHALCFDVIPLPARQDADGFGWLPGMFPIDGKLMLVFAPLKHHRPERRRRATHVLRLHQCGDSIWSVAA